MSCIITYKGQKYSEEQFKEYFINNKQEFVTSIAKNKDVIDSFKRKMEGINYVFSQSPELASIGSKAQYLQYLSTIFKTSKVKDIVYHGTENKELKKFYDNLRSGIHFGTLKQAEGRRRATDFEFKNNAKFIPVIIDLKNPLKTKDFDWEKAGNAFVMWQPGDDLSHVDFTEYLISSGIIKEEEIQQAEGDFDLINKKGYDGVIYKNEGAGEATGEDSYAVSKSKQIHILGSKEDIEGFKEFISSSNNIDPKLNILINKGFLDTEC